MFMEHWEKNARIRITSSRFLHFSHFVRFIDIKYSAIEPIQRVRPRKILNLIWCCCFIIFSSILSTAHSTSLLALDGDLMLKLCPVSSEINSKQNKQSKQTIQAIPFVASVSIYFFSLFSVKYIIKCSHSKLVGTNLMKLLFLLSIIFSL